jgi:DtxR family Mn-dependent transcriptional regulator
MHRDKPISETHEMYLKTLYSVRGPHEVAHVRDLANGLNVSPATVSGVLKKLERLRLVDHERYGLVALTPAGSRVAECVLRRFETIRNLLVEVLGVDPETAAVDACMMEHGVSPATVNRMQWLLARVRAGTATLPTRRALPKSDPCSRCEALEACQAAVRDDR